MNGVLLAAVLLLVFERVIGRNAACEDTTLTAPQGNISSPNYPDNYPEKLDCSTDIELADPNAIIIVNFTDFEFEKPDAKGCYDRLDVTDVGVAINGTETYCGYEGPFVYKSQTNHIRLTIHTDRAVTKRGYFAYYYASGYPVFENCPDDITGTSDNSSGSVESWLAPTAHAYTDGDDVSVTSTHKPGEIFPLGNTTVTYTATDSHGNTAECTFVITVEALETSDTSDADSSTGGRIIDNVPWYIIFAAVVIIVILISAVGFAIFFSCPTTDRKTEKVRLVKKYKSKDIDESIGKTEAPNP